MKAYFAAGLSGLIIGILLAIIFNSCNPEPQPVNRTSERPLQMVQKHDSSFKIPDPVPPAPLAMNGAKARIDTFYKEVFVPVHDTVFKIPEYVAALDSNLNGDTINLRYNITQNVFDLTLRRKQDSILVIKETVDNIIIEKQHPRFSVGVNASYGVGSDGKFTPYLGAGITLNLFSF